MFHPKFLATTTITTTTTEAVAVAVMAVPAPVPVLVELVGLELVGVPEVRGTHLVALLWV
jgi:hypothetical protein